MDYDSDENELHINNTRQFTTMDGQNISPELTRYDRMDGYDHTMHQSTTAQLSAIDTTSTQVLRKMIEHEEDTKNDVSERRAVEHDHGEILEHFSNQLNVIQADVRNDHGQLLGEIDDKLDKVYADVNSIKGAVGEQSYNKLYAIEDVKALIKQIKEQIVYLNTHVHNRDVRSMRDRLEIMCVGLEELTTAFSDKSNETGGWTKALNGLSATEREVFELYKHGEQWQERSNEGKRSRRESFYTE